MFNKKATKRKFNELVDFCNEMVKRVNETEWSIDRMKQENKQLEETIKRVCKHENITPVLHERDLLRCPDCGYEVTATASTITLLSQLEQK